MFYDHEFIEDLKKSILSFSGLPPSLLFQEKINAAFVCMDETTKENKKFSDKIKSKVETWQGADKNKYKSFKRRKR